MDKTLAVLVVGTWLAVGGTPGLAAQQDQSSVGRAFPFRIAGEESAVSHGRLSTGTASETSGAAWLTQETFGQIGKKLGRGLVNASTGWIELPKEMYRISRESNPTFGVVLGSFSGLELSAVRTLAGVYEVATFPVPIPAGYVPVVSPSFVFTREGLYLWSFSS